jgi:hypothetical protein
MVVSRVFTDCEGWKWGSEEKTINETRAGEAVSDDRDGKNDGWTKRLRRQTGALIVQYASVSNDSEGDQQHGCDAKSTS